jgi:hypothetical protein
LERFGEGASPPWIMRSLPFPTTRAEREALTCLAEIELPSLLDSFAADVAAIDAIVASIILIVSRLGHDVTRSGN